MTSGIEVAMAERERRERIEAYLRGELVLIHPQKARNLERVATLAEVYLSSLSPAALDQLGRAVAELYRPSTGDAK